MTGASQSAIRTVRVSVDMVASEWRSRIVELVLVKQALAEADRKALWAHHLPSVAATDAQLLAVEARLGESLQPSYREFLALAGGWRGFMQTIDLFGPEDFLGSQRWRRAQELLGYLDDDILSSMGFRREEVFPIAVSGIEIDLFLMGRRSSEIPGVVVWLAGDEIDRFNSFDDFYAAMVDYNRREIEMLRKA
jgi:hypothetical protein